MLYADVVAALRPTGMVARGGFNLADDDASAPPQPDGSPTRAVVVIGNIGGEMWPYFRAGEKPGADPLDTWTRSVLAPIATRIGAGFVHPSDEPFQPFQRWAQRADDVWQSPIGLLVHARHGLWHAYRGAFLFGEQLGGLPPVGQTAMPCATCADQPCLDSCPVDAFTIGHYDADACRTHVRSGDSPHCADLGCAARCACPVGLDHIYGPDQMQFHMRAFVGDGG